LNPARPGARHRIGQLAFAGIERGHVRGVAPERAFRSRDLVTHPADQTVEIQSRPPHVRAKAGAKSSHAVSIDIDHVEARI
jgi:hypothetical protein